MSVVPYQQFLTRRLFSLTGMVPLGVFLVEHFFTNGYSHQGEVVFNDKVHFLTTLPWLPVIEWFGLLLPLGFHAAYGLYIIYTGRMNVSHYPYGRNWLYTMQRVTAIIALGYIFYHVSATRFGYLLPYGANTRHPNFYHLMTEKFESGLNLAVYTIGIAAVCFHFANGIATFCMTWGLTVNPLAQKSVSAFGFMVGFGLFLSAMFAIQGFDKSGYADETTEPAEHHSHESHADEHASIFEMSPGAIAYV